MYDCIYLFDMPIFVFVFNQKEKKGKKSILTFQTFSGTALFRENRPVLSELCLGLFIYLSLIYCHPT